MSITIQVRNGNLEQALRVLKKKSQKNGLLKELKARQYYEKPSAKKRRKKKEGIANVKKKQAKKKISTNIPKGVDDGTRIRLSGKGEAGIKGGENGDLYIFVSVDSHNIFKRSEENLFFEFPISLADATLGTTVEVPTIDGGKAKVKIPAGTQHGKQFRLRDKGMPIIRSKDYGDLYIRVVTEVPTSLTREQKSLLEQFKKLEDTKSNPTIKNFFEKAKRFWKN